jgi:hypothetical protein
MLSTLSRDVMTKGYDDDYEVAQVQELQEKKATAVAEEDYEEAKKLKLAIDR